MIIVNFCFHFIPPPATTLHAIRVSEKDQKLRATPNAHDSDDDFESHEIFSLSPKFPQSRTSPWTIWFVRVLFSLFLSLQERFNVINFSLTKRNNTKKLPPHSRIFYRLFTPPYASFNQTKGHPWVEVVHVHRDFFLGWMNSQAFIDRNIVLCWYRRHRICFLSDFSKSCRFQIKL